MYSNILEAIRYLCPNHEVLNCLEKDGLCVNRKFPTAIDTGKGTIAIAFLDFDTLYFRGENDQYPSCKSSLYRIKDKDKRICELVKTYDFINLLDTLDNVIEWKNNKLLYDPWAIAQHYEFSTPMIDLTHDILVAAFFATHKYNNITRQYEIISEGVGQIRYINELIEVDNKLKLIGMQPFSRPSAQDGYGYWIDEDKDFSNESNIIEFKQDAEVNKRLDIATGGLQGTFFPNESLNYVANIIKQNKVITSMAIDRMFNEYKNGRKYIQDLSKDDIFNSLNSNEYYIADAPIAIKKHIEIYVNKHIDERKLIKKKPILV